MPHILLLLTIFLAAAVAYSAAAQDASGLNGHPGSALEAASSGESDGTVSFSVSQTWSLPEDAAVLPQSSPETTFILQPRQEGEDSGYSANIDSDYTITGTDGMNVVGNPFSMKGKDASVSLTAKFQHAGVYIFDLKQTTPYADAYKYDQTAFVLRFYVKNEGSGALGVLVTAESGEKGASAKCTDIV